MHKLPSVVRQIDADHDWYVGYDRFGTLTGRPSFRTGAYNVGPRACTKRDACQHSNELEANIFNALFVRMRYLYSSNKYILIDFNVTEFNYLKINITS